MLTDNHSFKTLLLSGTAYLFLAGNAFALDANAVAERFKDTFSGEQATLTYDQARLEGSNVVLQDVNVVNSDGKTVAALGALALQDVSEDSASNYRIGRIAIDEFSREEAGAKLSVKGLDIRGLQLPASNASGELSGIGLYDRLDLENISFAIEGNEILAMDDLWATYQDNGQGKLTTESAIGAMGINVLALAEMDAAPSNSVGEDDEDGEIIDEATAAAEKERNIANIKALGLEQVNGSVKASGFWNMSDGQLELSDMDFNLDKIGRLNLSMNFGGVTPELWQTLTEFAKNAEMSQEALAAQSQSLIGLAAFLNLGNVNIRFEDKAFITRAINLNAAETGMTADTLAAMAEMLIPEQLAPYTGQQFAENTAKALSSFLRNPGTIELSASPAAPVPFMAIGVAAMTAPAALIQQLGLKISSH